MAEHESVFVELEVRGPIVAPTLLSRIVACDEAIFSAAGIKDPAPVLKTMTEERNLLMHENHKLKGELEAVTRKAREVNERFDTALAGRTKEVDRRVKLLAIHLLSRPENVGPEVTTYLVILSDNGAVQTFRVVVVESKIHDETIYCTNGERGLERPIVDVRMRRNLYAAVTAYHQKTPPELPLVLGEEEEESS